MRKMHIYTNFLEIHYLLSVASTTTMTDRSYLRSGSLNTGQLYEFIRKAFLDRIVHAGTLPSKVRPTLSRALTGMKEFW
jgi:hypothetical protein